MRYGIDLGGTKIEIIALGDGGRELLRERVPTPQSAYEDTIRAMRDLVLAADAKLGVKGTLGVGIPGSISTNTGLVKNANSTRLIGHPLDRNLAEATARPVRVANDANCLALSEASDGAAAGFDVVFAVIAGTGVGGGAVVGGRVLNGAHGIAGEWGHNGLPRITPEELAASQRCYCGRENCIESWCSGPSVSRQYAALTGRNVPVHEIVLAARGSDADALTVMEGFYDRFARSIATLVNVLDPDAIVLGGGLSNIDALYDELPPRVEHHAFTTEGRINIVRNKHGDSSGVRGAAWLWPLET
jgi:fructokinase